MTLTNMFRVEEMPFVSLNVVVFAAQVAVVLVVHSSHTWKNH